MPIEHLSKSQISLYMDCSLKYKFQYIDNLPKPFKPAGLAFGTSIHSALEWLQGTAQGAQRILGKGFQDFRSRLVRPEGRRGD